jgi:hypothetical protein
MPATGSTPGLKSRLWEELALKADLITGGVAITPQALELAAPWRQVPGTGAQPVRDGFRHA